METKQPMQLELKPDMVVEVLTLSNRLTFVGKIERYANGTLTIREGTGGELPPVLYNKEVKLRLFQKEHNVVLRGKICGSTRWLWMMDRLENQFIEEKRNFFRQHVNLEARAKCTKRVEETPAEAKAHWGRNGPGYCQILDISAGGLLLKSRETLQQGDQLFIDGLAIVREERPFSFYCRVQRVKELPGASEYGCQFEELSSKEQDRLLRAIFIAQRKEIKNQKDRDE